MRPCITKTWFRFSLKCILGLADRFPTLVSGGSGENAPAECPTPLPPSRGRGVDWGAAPPLPPAARGCRPGILFPAAPETGGRLAALAAAGEPPLVRRLPMPPVAAKVGRHSRKNAPATFALHSSALGAALPARAPGDISCQLSHQVLTERKFRGRLLNINRCSTHTRRKANE